MVWDVFVGAQGACLLAPGALLGVLEEPVVPGYKTLCDPEAE